MKHTISVYTLEKGSQLLVVNAPGAESTYMSISIRGGFRSVSRSKYHVPHLLEHMVYEGSANYSTSQAISEAIERNGGYFNASTDDEYLNFEFYVAREDLDTIMPVALDCIYAPLLKEEAFDEERQVIANEINEQMGDYAGVLDYYTQMAVLPDLYPGFDEQLKDLSKINHRDTLDYHNEYFVTTNSFFVIAGDIDSNANGQIIHKLNQLLNGVRTGKLAELKKLKLEDQGPVLGELEAPKSTNAGFSLAFVSLDTSDKAIATKKVIDGLLLNGATSRLQNAVRKAGLAYGVSGGDSTNQEYGLFSLSGPCDRSSIDKLFKVIVRELRGLAEGFINQAEVDRSKGNIIGGLKRGLESPVDLAKWYEYELVSGSAITSPDQRINDINTVSTEDVITMARDLFKRENMIIYVIGYKIKQKYNQIVYYCEAAFNSKLTATRRVGNNVPTTSSDTIQGQMISTSCTQGWFDFHSGELWITDAGILRIHVTLKEVVKGEDEYDGKMYPKFQGISPSGLIKKTVLSDPAHIFISKDDIESYALHKGTLNGRLRISLRNGQRRKFLFLKNDMDYEVIRTALDKWVASTN